MAPQLSGEAARRAAAALGRIDGVPAPDVEARCAADYRRLIVGV